MVTQRLTRAAHDKVIAGVCGGLGRYFDIDPVIVRLIMLGLVFAGGIGFLIYPVLWLVMPMDGAAQYTLGASLHEIRREAHVIGQQAVQQAQTISQQASQQVQAMFNTPHYDPQTGQPLNGTQPAIDPTRRKRVLGAIMLGVGVMMLASYFGSTQIAMALIILGSGIYLLRRSS